MNIKPHYKKHLLTEYATGEKISSLYNFYSSLPDPDEILKENNYDYSILRNLLLDPHLSAVVQQRKGLVTQLGWEINYDGRKEISKKVVKWIERLNMQNIINNILDAVLYGFNVMEIIWEIKNGEIIPAKLEQKPAEWFIFDKDNSLHLRKKDTFGYSFVVGESIPPYKMLITQHNPCYVNPYGEKLISRCFWSVTLKRVGLDYWNTMMQRYGMPFMIGRYSPNATPQQKDELLDSLYGLVSNNIAVFQEGITIELKESPGYDFGQLYRFLEEFYNGEISKAILTVTLTTELGNVGSYAAAAEHKNLLTNIGLTDKKLVENTLNELIKYYCMLNFSVDDYPKIKLQKKESIIDANIDRDKILSEMGVVFSKEYFVKRYNLALEDFEFGKSLDREKVKSNVNETIL